MEVKHEYTEDIVCPYCGKEPGDSFDFIDDDGEIECHSCEQSFSYERHRRISYTTYKYVPDGN